MKMNRQNPGGEEVSNRTMKGCEKYMANGQGKVLQGGYLLKRGTTQSDCKLEGMAKGGNVRSTAHAHTSMSGTIGPVGTGRGLK